MLAIYVVLDGEKTDNVIMSADLVKFLAVWDKKFFLRMGFSHACDDALPLYLLGNGGLLLAIAIITAGFG